ncbi:MAG: AraC family transcriptional regulator [Rhizomicrobium sp.]
MSSASASRGRIAFEQSGEALLVEGMRAAIVPPWERRLMRWSAGTTLIGVTISESTFRRETLSMLQGAFTLRLGAARSFDVSVNPGKTFLDILEMLQADLAGVQSSRNNKSIRLLFDRLIVYSLLRVVEDDVKQPARETNRSLAPRHIKRAEEYIKVHLADHLDNALLASVAEVSPRSLYRGFVHFRGVTPARYIQDLRLDEAHKLLTDRGATSDIKVIASRAGFRSYASFWRSYVRKYGTTPSKARPPRRSADVEGAPTPEGDS